MTLTRLLKKHGACKEAVAWAKPYKTLQEAWDACERGDWMLWLLAKLHPEDRKPLVWLACLAAERALPIWRKRYPNDDRPAKCVETAKAWCRGEATDEQRHAAAAAAAYAGDCADAAPYAYAAAACADAASYAYAAAYAADAAAAAADAHKRELLWSARMVRRHVHDPTALPTEPWRKR